MLCASNKLKKVRVELKREEEIPHRVRTSTTETSLMRTLLVVSSNIIPGVGGKGRHRGTQQSVDRDDTGGGFMADGGAC